MDRKIGMEDDEKTKFARKKRYVGSKLKKEYPIYVKITIDLIITGVLWILTGILYAISMKTGLRTYKLMLVVTLLILILLKLLGFYMNFTKGDEMSDIHYQKARADTYSNMLAMISVWALIGVACDLHDYTFVTNWYSWILMLIGFMELWAGIKFYRLEKGGDI